MIININPRKTITIGLLILAVAASSVFLWEKFGRPLSAEQSSPDNGEASNQNQTYNSSDYPLINESVTSNLDKHFIINFTPLRDRLFEIQKEYPQKVYAYFLYLNNGSWIGINERENFTAASMVKVPLAMAFYKAVEDGKIDPNTPYIVRDEDLDVDFGELYKAGAGVNITGKEVARIMLESSDNTAKNVVARIMNDTGIADPLDSVYSFFGWTFDVGETPGYSKINLRTLSNMFIALYNARYNSIEHSQLILEYLSKTPFDDKIAAGLPKAVVVSHKVGIADSNQTFSDCGIVYAPNRHYVLCLGSNGGNEAAANKYMAQVSKEVYSYVINN